METNKEMKEIKETREVYEAPVMEIVEIKVELGFQMSGGFESYDSLRETIR